MYLIIQVALIFYLFVSFGSWVFFEENIDMSYFMMGD